MTTSQSRSLIFTIATVVSTICAAVLPQIQSLPDGFKFYGSIVSIIGAAASAVVVAMNQSLSSEHISVPVEKALDLGLVRKIGGELIPAYRATDPPDPGKP